MGPKCTNAKPDKDEVRSSPSVGLSSPVVQRGWVLRTLWALLAALGLDRRETCSQQGAWLACLLAVSPPHPWCCASAWAALKGACCCCLGHPSSPWAPDISWPWGVASPHPQVVPSTWQALGRQLMGTHTRSCSSDRSSRPPASGPEGPWELPGLPWEGQRAREGWGSLPKVT